jgi:hypothetical protein
MKVNFITTTNMAKAKLFVIMDLRMMVSGIIINVGAMALLPTQINLYILVTG